MLRAVQARKPTIVALVVVALLAGGAYGFWRWRESVAAEAVAQAARDAEQRDRDQMARSIELVARLERESQALMPPPLDSIALGMQQDEVRRARHAMQRSRTQGDPDKIFFEEQLPNGASVMYGFQKRGLRLTQIQVLSLLPNVEALGPHLTAMNETYGSPTGVWDCPDAEGVPTRRFTWRRSLVTVADVFLIFRGRISVTLYVAPSEVIGASLVRARCTPVARDHIGEFPIATDEQMSAHGGRGVPGIGAGPGATKAVPRGAP